MKNSGVVKMLAVMRVSRINIIIYEKKVVCYVIQVFFPFKIQYI